MRPLHTTLLLTLLCTVFGCAAQVTEQASSTGATESPLDSAHVGLTERPHNATCIAGPATQVPQKLSQLGCMDSEDRSQPGPALVPYDVNAPLWSDDADKQRFLAIPDGTSITVDAEGKLVLPSGAMLIKSFSHSGQLLETRVWMNHPDVGFRGYLYRWSQDGADAELAGEAGEQMPIGAGGQTWAIPARGQCGQCHQSNESPNLGLQVAQLDRDFTYPSTGRTANQLDTLEALGLLALAMPTPVSQPASQGPSQASLHASLHASLVNPRDASKPLEARARSYLHTNCSSCHSKPED